MCTTPRAALTFLAIVAQAQAFTRISKEIINFPYYKRALFVKRLDAVATALCATSPDAQKFVLNRISLPILYWGEQTIKDDIADGSAPLSATCCEAFLTRATDEPDMLFPFELLDRRALPHLVVLNTLDFYSPLQTLMTIVYYKIGDQHPFELTMTIEDYLTQYKPTMSAADYAAYFAGYHHYLLGPEKEMRTIVLRQQHHIFSEHKEPVNSKPTNGHHCILQ